MEGIRIFDGISDCELEQMLDCFKAKRRKFNSGSNVTQKAGSSLGVILSGEADLIRFDYDGYRNIMEHLSQGDVFGEAGAVFDGEELAVICDRKCEILFIDHSKIVKPCAKACPYHSTLISNLLNSTEQKVQSQRRHLDVLSRRTLRNKLITYFKICAGSQGSNSFTLPFNLADLAGYLFVDRSAMLREMKKLRDDGIITSHGRKITLK